MRRPSSARGALCALLILLAPLGCADPTDRPEDCAPGEFYDEGDQRCARCPSLALPSCSTSCGPLLELDARGCTIARCPLRCDRCGEGEVFDESLLGCRAACAKTESWSPTAGRCCAPPPPLSCDELGCSCRVVPVSAPGACPALTCGECSEPRAGFEVDEAGACIRASRP